MSSPCFDNTKKVSCSDRCAGCASKCAKWADYVKKRNAKYAEKAARNKIERDYCRTRHIY